MTKWNSDFQVGITRLINALQNDVDLRKMSASNGTKFYNDTTSYVGLNVTTIIIREDTVFTALSGKDINGNDVNFLTEFNISGETLTSPDLLVTKNGWKITTIELTSGSILTY